MCLQNFGDLYELFKSIQIQILQKRSIEIEDLFFKGLAGFRAIRFNNYVYFMLAMLPPYFRENRPKTEVLS